MPEMIEKQDIEKYLATVTEAYLQTDLISAGAVRNLRVETGNVHLALNLGYPCGDYGQKLAEQLRDDIQAMPGVERAEVTVGFSVQAHAVQPTLKRLPAIRNIIAVASGKGGVGKSTVAANLALALAADGARVGMLDADIYGPSQPRMLGVERVPSATQPKVFEPALAHGLQTMSIGYMVDQDSPTIWRGPMVTQALTQLLFQTRWDNLDYLIVDMPPGTGDTQLTLAQKIPVAGAIIVTTPQDLALLDARKGLKMFEKVNVPVLGVVENMSTHICSQCGHEEAIFGYGGGQQLADESTVELLGQLPLNLRIREQADSGRPTVVAEPASELAGRYFDIARRTTAALARKKKDYSAVFPNIVVENS